jgi:hypothetical protein
MCVNVYIFNQFMFCKYLFLKLCMMYVIVGRPSWMSLHS